MSPRRSSWPLKLAALSLAGLAVSVYLWSAKAGKAEFVCGVYGDCAGVNASPYSIFFGIPVAALGTFMYVTLTVLLFRVWKRPGPTLHLLGFALALCGALFSLYLTGVEAFVLGTYCIWCVVSWLLITSITLVWGWQLWVMSEVD